MSENVRRRMSQPIKAAPAPTGIPDAFLGTPRREDLDTAALRRRVDGGPNRHIVNRLCDEVDALRAERGPQVESVVIERAARALARFDGWEWENLSSDAQDRYWAQAEIVLDAARAVLEKNN